MRRLSTLLLPALLLASTLAGCLSGSGGMDAHASGAGDGRDAVVVVAVLDWQMNPYHWDFLAAHMPQHRDGDPSTDLPLHLAPHEWLPGFPDPSSFAGYEGLHLTLTPDDPDAVPQDLYEEDEAEWAKVQQSTRDGIHYHYIPGTKVVGFITTADQDGFAASSHGVGASSVSVGNIYGTCPNCLLVYVNIPGTAGEEWVRQQDWIDVTTHSYEASTTGVARDNIRDCDTSMQQAAAERGQQIFWAAGNGLLNTFNIPQTTLVNCQKGPDWTVTVGAIHPDSHGSFVGHGKPVHVASIGTQYPRAGGGSVTADATFGGTSNASPVAAGLYAQALYRLRAEWSDAPRMQAGGVIATGPADCGDADPDCPLADGILTAHELREAYFRAAQRLGVHFHSPVAGPLDVGTDETRYWTEGYGSFLGRLGDWEAEVQAIVDEAMGHSHTPADADLAAWMTAYSWCVQQIWGAWEHGVWDSSATLPGPDPMWPQRSWMASPLCPTTVNAVLGRTPT